MAVPGLATALRTLAPMLARLLAPVTAVELARWRDVAERIARENDVPLLDFNDGTFVASDFGDRTHLHPLAAERFSSLLATRIRPFLQEDRVVR
jgi:lysophospholipase L1-like esterase